MLVYSFVIFVDHAGAARRFPDHVCGDPAGVRHVDQCRDGRRCCGTSTAWISRSSCSTCYWLHDLLSGNLGLSLEYQRPNAELIGEQLGLTIALAVMSLRADLGDRDTGGHLLGHAPTLAVGSPADRDQLRRRGDAELHAGADPDVGRLRLFRPQRHRTVLTGICRCAVEPGASRRPAGAYLAAGAGAGHRRHRAADAHHACQPAGRVEQAVCGDGAGQGTARVAAGAALSGAAGAQSIDQHDRLVPAAAVLRAA